MSEPCRLKRLKLKKAMKIYSYSQADKRPAKYFKCKKCQGWHVINELKFEYKEGIILMNGESVCALAEGHRLSDKDPSFVFKPDRVFSRRQFHEITEFCKKLVENNRGKIVVKRPWWKFWEKPAQREKK